MVSPSLDALESEGAWKSLWHALDPVQPQGSRIRIVAGRALTAALPADVPEFYC